MVQYLYMNKTQVYQNLLPQIESLLSAETDATANMANLAAALYHGLPDLNWAGFYILRAGELVLGPFQGKPACVRIAVGKGVCGTAAARLETVLVSDVHRFPGHIACDAASNSEIVIPVRKDGALWGVLDLDSPLLNRFDETDRQYLEQAAAYFAKRSRL